MTLKSLQIVCFDNPFPANFGGVIDVYFKLKALHDKGVKLYLHVFYHERSNFEELEAISEVVYSYKRNTSFFNFFSIKPFRIKTRCDEKLFSNLNKHKVPILFEGLQSTSVLFKEKIDLPVFIRTHNIEHEYSFGLSRNSSNWFLKIVHYIEAYKLLKAESIVRKASVVFSISKSDVGYFKSNFDVDVIYLPPFHSGRPEQINSFSNNSNYALYHGDLGSADNVKSVLYLINIFKDLNYKFVVASSVSSNEVNKLLKKTDNCTFIEVDKNSDFELDELVSSAQVNVLYSYQKSGTKLKVYNALYKGKHVIVNANIVDDEDILSLCHLANSKQELIEQIHRLFKIPYTPLKSRDDMLKNFQPSNTIDILIDSIESKLS